MIGSLEGTIDFLNSPYAIVKVGGVGYKVLLPATLISRLKINQKINLFTYTYVREDALELFGFESFENLKLFENLIGISGIGPKTAINIFSFGDKNEIVEAIIKADVDFFTAIPRLGKKNAQRIIIELKSKMGGLGDLDLTEEDRKAHGEIIEALVTFGFTSREAKEAIKAIKDQGKTTEEKIKLALKYLGK
jgi:Holliday junction DNA helicase RuvA